MSTLLQKRLAVNIASGNFKSLKELLVSTGYSVKTAKAYPGEVVVQKGVREELERMGFNEQAARAKVAEILLLGDDNQALRAADMIFKAFGTYAPEKLISLNVEIEANPEIKELTKTLNEIYERTSVSGDGGLSGLKLLEILKQAEA